MCPGSRLTVLWPLLTPALPQRPSRIREHVNACLNPVCRVSGILQHRLCGLLLPGVKICGLCLRLLRSDPSPVVRHKRRQFRLRVRVTGKRTEHFHAEFDVGNLGRRNLFHFGGRNPRRLHRVAHAAGGVFIRRSRKHRGPRRIQTRRDTECRQLARPIRPPVHP